jgi:dTDP-glucose pyrophosphorylase
MMHIKSIREFSCRPDTPMRDVLARFNDLSHPLHVVIDESGRLVGTLTDGDIRRALLKGATIDDPVSVAVHKGATAGRAGDAGNAALLRSVPFLPVLNKDNVVVEILVSQRGASTISTALIMAGGLGERLGSRTQSVPKPLLPIGGKPILEHIVARLEDINVGDIYVSAHYLADKIESYVAGRSSRSNIRVIRENERLGTAGAVAAVPENGEAPLLVINGDVLTQTDFVALAEFHQSHGYDATLAVARYDIQVPFGVVRSDEQGLFCGVEEKPTFHHFVAAGIYYLAPQMRALASPNKPLDMPELLNMGRSIGLRIGLFPIHEYWIDVGRPNDLETAERDHSADRPVPLSTKASS